MQLLHPSKRDLAPEDLFDLYDVGGPHLRAGFVLSVDGAATVGGVSAPLGSPADKAVFRALRAVADVVLVGAGTARAEDYGPVKHTEAATQWRAANGRAPVTPLVVMSRSGRIPPESRFLAGPTIVAAPEGVAVAGCEVLHATDPRQLLAALRDRGLTRVLCEGGPSLLTELFAADVVDELCLTTSPLAVGDGKHLVGDLGAPRELQLLSLVHDDPGVLLARWAVVRSDA